MAAQGPIWLNIHTPPELEYGPRYITGEAAHEFRELATFQMERQDLSRVELAKRAGCALRTIERLFSKSPKIKKTLARKVTEALIPEMEIDGVKARPIFFDERGRGLGRMLSLSRDLDVFEYPELGSRRLLAAAYAARLVEAGKISPRREDEFAETLRRVADEMQAVIELPIASMRHAGKRPHR